jgi:hypothetical protein
MPLSGAHKQAMVLMRSRTAAARIVLSDRWREVDRRREVAISRTLVEPNEESTRYH